MTAGRLSDRESMLKRLDQMSRTLDDEASLAGMGAFKAQAIELITSPRVRQAFDIEAEPKNVRELYGADVTMQHDYQFGRTWHNSQFSAGAAIGRSGRAGGDHWRRRLGPSRQRLRRQGNDLRAFARAVAPL